MKDAKEKEARWAEPVRVTKKTLLAPAAAVVPGRRAVAACVRSARPCRTGTVELAPYEIRRLRIRKK
ncbi:MAG TPA: hypothetical protein VFW70_18835 [Methylomirabilota bacterium]|nr:hypothetical protein [Methylomirabilota bacterium]